VAELLTRQSLSLSAANAVFTSARIAVDALTESITVSLRRPTTAAPLAWRDTAKLRVSIVVVVDGVEHSCVGTVSGGVRTGTDGLESGVYRLRYRLPEILGEKAREYMRTATKDAEGYYNDVPLTRLCELAVVERVAFIRIERLSGSIETEILIGLSEAAPAPTVRTKNSVAFDAATDAKEESGDGVLSLTHTAGGTDRAAFAGSANIAGSLSTSITYAGTGMTEMWDATTNSSYSHHGYQLAGDANIPASAQTVTSTLVSISMNEHFLGVITMTGVDSTTPVGTAATAFGTGEPASVTVGSVGADDLVVENFMCAGGTPAEGADQTVRNTENGTFEGGRYRQSTQPGSAGGVMSYPTFDGFSPWNLGAVAFKPVAAGGADFAATGDLDAQAATVAGSALHGRVSTGTLAAQSAAIAGSGIVGRTSSGALAVQAATLSGTAHVGRASSGALAAGNVTIEGAASVSRAAVGALAAGVFLISGLARINRVATGALAAADATISGTGEASGAPISEPEAGPHPLSNLLRLHLLRG